jgi:hypothetical protein
MMVKQAIRDPGPPGAIAPIVVRAIEETSDPEHPQVHWVVDHRESNLAVLTHLRLERAEIVLAINCSAGTKFEILD